MNTVNEANMNEGNTMTTKPQTTLTKVKYLAMLNSLLGLFIGLLAFFNQPNVEKPNVEKMDTANFAQSSQPTTISQNNELAGLPYVSRDSLQQQATANQNSYQNSYQTVAVRQTQQQPRIRARSSR